MWVHPRANNTPRIDHLLAPGLGKLGPSPRKRHASWMDQVKGYTKLDVRAQSRGLLASKVCTLISFFFFLGSPKNKHLKPQWLQAANISISHL